MFLYQLKKCASDFKNTISVLMFLSFVVSFLSHQSIKFWLHDTMIKFCPVLSGSRQCYKLLINYILRLYVKSFIPARRDPSFVMPGSRFAGMEFSHIIDSAYLSGMKKCFNTCLHTIVGWNLTDSFWNISKI